MTHEEFWQSSFADLALRTEAYKRNARPSAMYFREMFCLLYNINRSEKSPALEPKELMSLHGEKAPRQPRRERSLIDDPEAMADLNRRINEMARREKAEADLFGLESYAYTMKRAKGEITREMVEEAMRKRYFEENPDADEDSFEMPILTNPRLLGDDGTQDAVKPSPTPHPVVDQPAIGAVEVVAEPEMIAEDRSYVPPGLTGEPIPIQPSQWD